MDQADNNASWLHGGDLAAQQLAAEGIKHLFTLTGGHICSLYDGSRDAGISLVDFRHEQAAVHAADAYARLSRSPAVAALTAGPGVTGGLTAVANAYYANSPTIVLGGRNPFALDTAGNLQDAPHLELMRPITKSAHAVYDPWRIRETIREAFQAATTPRFGPTYVDLPVDIQFTRWASGEVPPVRQPARSGQFGPDNDLVCEVAKALAVAKRPLVLAGSGAYWGRAERALREFVEVASLPVFVNGMSRGLLGRSHPNQVVSGRPRALKEADLLLVLGADFDFRLGFGQPGIINPEAVVIQVDPDGRVLGRNRDVSIAIQSEIVPFLASLMSFDFEFMTAADPAWMDELRLRDRGHVQRKRLSLDLPDRPIHPLRFAEEVAQYIDESTIVIGDGGDIVTLFAETFRPGGPGQWMDPGPFGCLGIGVPFAIGARLARPTQPILVCSGDGAFGFNGFEFDSAVRQGFPLVVVVGNDGAWGEMRTFHEDIFGPDDPSAQYLSQATEYETVVRGLGGFGQRVERASEIIPALERAFASGVPALVNVILDPRYRRQGSTISGKQVVLAFGDGDPDAYKRKRVDQRQGTNLRGGGPAEQNRSPYAPG